MASEHDSKSHTVSEQLQRSWPGFLSFQSRRFLLQPYQTADPSTHVAPAVHFLDGISRGPEAHVGAGGTMHWVMGTPPSGAPFTAERETRTSSAQQQWLPF